MLILISVFFSYFCVIFEPGKNAKETTSSVLILSDFPFVEG